MPIDLKISGIQYRLTDGSTFQPPYGDIHHRNETLIGLGDARFMGRWSGAIQGTPLLLNFGLGLSLPTGRIEDDPFAAAALEQEHQHLQFGNGTFDPMIDAALIVRGQSWGLIARGHGRIPLYANSKGYRGSRQIGAEVGPTLRLPAPVDTLQLSMLAGCQWLSPEFWGGAVGENSGQLAVALRMGLSWNITPRLALQGNLVTRIYERSEGAQFKRPLAFTLGISGIVARPRPGKAKQGHQH